MLEEIWKLLLPNILEIIWIIISLIISRYIIPCIKTDLIPWLKEKHLYGDVKKFVQAVEKLAESGIIQKADKKQKVIELLTNKGIKVDESVDILIESCVKELDMLTSVIYEEIKKIETQQ